MTGPVVGYLRFVACHTEGFSRAVGRFSRALKKKVKRLITRNSEPPEDPYSYVTAPRRPRLPHLSAAAVADLPEE
jgi:hypothetical protein